MSQAGQTGSRHAPDVTKSEYGNLSWILRFQTINPQVFSMAREHGPDASLEPCMALVKWRSHMQIATAAASPADALEREITSRTARVGIVGLGYVGLPLAVEFAKAGFAVTGIDVQETKVARLNWGDSYIQDVPSAVLSPLL